MKLGRNDPCSCGSGKKYKKCCLLKAESSRSLEMTYNSIRTAENRLFDKLFIFLEENFPSPGSDLIDHAWQDFFGESFAEKPPFDPNSTLVQLFYPWLMFKWKIPTKFRQDARLKGKRNLTISQALQIIGTPKLLSDELEVLTAFEPEEYSFWEILSLKPGQSMKIRDVLTGRECELTERKGSLALSQAFVVFGAVADIRNHAVFIGSGPRPFAPQDKCQMIEIRKDLKTWTKSEVLTRSHLRQSAQMLREYYLKYDQKDENPSNREFRNTDQEIIDWQKLVYSISSADEAFHALKDLSEGDSEQDLLELAELDGEGQISQVEFSWKRKQSIDQSGFEAISLGNIMINRRSMAISVNSKERAERARSEIERRLGDRAVYQRTVHTNVQAELAARMTAVNADESQPSAEEFPPEVQQQLMEHMTEMMEQHWNRWIHQEIPALGNQTPMEAAKTADGREALEALFAQFEMMDRNPGRDSYMPATDTNKLRRMLGM